MHTVKGILLIQWLLLAQFSFVEAQAADHSKGNSGVTTPLPLVLKDKITAFDGEEFDYFGYASGFDGSHMLVSAFGDDEAVEDGGSIYHYAINGESWEFQQKLFPSDIQPNDGFGHRVVMFGNLAFVSSRYADTNTNLGVGAVYFFEFDGNQWQERQKLDASASAMNGDDEFGDSLSIAEQFVVVGAGRGEGIQTNTGTAHVYELINNHWTETQVLMASDGTENADFGYSSYVDGDRILVGARFAFDESNKKSGAAYVYEFNGATWEETQKLTSNGSSGLGRFGTRVALMGNIAMVSDSWSEDNLGDRTGAVYVFFYDGKEWIMTQKLMASDRMKGDEFGSSISLSEHRLVVAARRHNGHGAAYVFEPNEFGSWVEIMKVEPDDGANNDLFGSSGQSGDQVLFTSPWSNPSGRSSGSVYLTYPDLIFADGYHPSATNP